MTGTKEDCRENHSWGQTETQHFTIKLSLVCSNQCWSTTCAVTEEEKSKMANTLVIYWFFLLCFTLPLRTSECSSRCFTHSALLLQYTVTWQNLKWNVLLLKQRTVPIFVYAYSKVRRRVCLLSEKAVWESLCYGKAPCCFTFLLWQPWHRAFPLTPSCSNHTPPLHNFCYSCKFKPVSTAVAMVFPHILN